MKARHGNPSEHLSPPYRGVIQPTSEEIYRRLTRTANVSIQIYSTYHRPMFAHSPTKLYTRPFGVYHITKHDISNYRRPIAGTFLSEHVMTS